MTIDHDSDSQHDSSEVEQEKDHEPIASFEPFDIVLVDIQAAVKKQKIHCVKKQMAPGVDLKYVAISYRWGELEERMVRATDYNAHITSFDIDQFLYLCEAISEEVDLCTMQYIWVDAICVDQANETRRKATIYHMNEIYECANWILCVPDLNRSYSEAFPLDEKLKSWLSHNSDYIYHILMNNKNHATDLDNRWMQDFMKLPEDLRCYLRSTEKLRSVSFFEDGLIEGLSRIEDQQSNNNGQLNIKSFCQQIQKWQREADERYDYIERVCSFLQNRILDWSNRTWVISEYSIAQKKNNGIIKFWFATLNVYIYARRFRSESEPTFRFFDTDISAKPRTIDDYKSDTIQTNTRRVLPFTSDSLDMASELIKTPKTEGSPDEFFRMLLRSKASRNSDRFNAILPLFEKYKRHVKNQDTIKNWHITDMVSVRMRVCQWLTALENLGFLYKFHYRKSGVMLPSFDQTKMDKVTSFIPLPSRYYEYASSRLNYDLKSSNPPAVIIKDKIDDIDVSTLGGSAIQLRYSMYLMPKFYQYKAIAFQQDVSEFISDGVWKEIGIDLSVDQLVWLRIPFYFQCDDPQSRENITEHRGIGRHDCKQIHISGFWEYPPRDRDKVHQEAKNLGNTLNLIGSDTKNVWIVIDLTSDLLSKQNIDSLDEWDWRKHGDHALRIY